jgi:hypothetical protein
VRAVNTVVKAKGQDECQVPMMMMMILIYVQGKPKYSRPPEGYRDVLS